MTTVTETRAEVIARTANRIIAEIDHDLPGDPELLGLTFVGAVLRLLHRGAEDAALIGPWVVDIERYLWLKHEWLSRPSEAGDFDPEGDGEIRRRFQDRTLGAQWWAEENERDAYTCACHLAGMAA